MKFWKSIFLSACAFIAVASTVTYTSCEKDSCNDLKCKNGGSCAEGFCRCKTGYDGAECELKVADRFIGVYKGLNHCNDDPALRDTLNVRMKTEPNVLEFFRRSDSTVRWTGVANGYNIVVEDIVSGNSRTHITVTVDVKEITTHVETYANGKKSICDFVGVRL